MRQGQAARTIGCLGRVEKKPGGWLAQDEEKCGASEVAKVSTSQTRQAS